MNLLSLAWLDDTLDKSPGWSSWFPQRKNTQSCRIFPIFLLLSQIRRPPPAVYRAQLHIEPKSYPITCYPSAQERRWEGHDQGGKALSTPPLLSVTHLRMCSTLRHHPSFPCLLTFWSAATGSTLPKVGEGGSSRREREWGLPSDKK